MSEELVGFSLSDFLLWVGSDSLFTVIAMSVREEDAVVRHSYNYK